MEKIAAPIHDLLEKLDDIKRMLRVRATNDSDGREDDPERYKALRSELLAHTLLSPHLPKFLRTCRTLDEFWPFIKAEYSSYAERRAFLQREFEKAYENLEARLVVPQATVDAAALSSVSWERVQEVMSKVQGRQADDPEGAITAARTLLETVCKHILEERGFDLERHLDLAELYRLTVEQLNLSPAQHSEQVFKKILGGCFNVVDGLSSVRNALGDAHGKGKVAARPAPRHAELAANVAIALASFLVATLRDKEGIKAEVRARGPLGQLP